MPRAARQAIAGQPAKVPHCYDHTRIYTPDHPEGCAYLGTTRGIEPGMQVEFHMGFPEMEWPIWISAQVIAVVDSYHLRIAYGQAQHEETIRVVSPPGRVGNVRRRLWRAE